MTSHVPGDVIDKLEGGGGGNDHPTINNPRLMLSFTGSLGEKAQCSGGTSATRIPPAALWAVQVTEDSTRAVGLLKMCACRHLTARAI